MAAILMTSLLGPDAELRGANWLKLLQIPQSLILYRSPKIVTKFTRDHFFWPIRHRLHTFVEIDHDMISTVILLPSADSFMKGCCQLQAKVCARITG